MPGRRRFEEPTVVEVELHLVGERVELLEILGEEALLADRFEAGGGLRLLDDRFGVAHRSPSVRV